MNSSVDAGVTFSARLMPMVAGGHADDGRAHGRLLPTSRQQRATLPWPTSEARTSTRTLAGDLINPSPQSAIRNPQWMSPSR
jgi:hypothetical protein